MNTFIICVGRTTLLRNTAEQFHPCIHFCKEVNFMLDCSEMLLLL